ncbi:MAG: hypothetical protein ABUL62_24915 [Myxococcales bacterium]|jgi:hypothetical protein
MARSSFPPLEDDFTRALLRSAEGDEPSHAAYAKAATALGVGAGLGVGASLAAPSALAAGAAGAARWSGSTALRLWALGVSGALIVGGGALLLNAHAPLGAPSGHGAKVFAGRAPLLQPSPVAPQAVLIAPQVSPSPSSDSAQPAAGLDADELAAEAAREAAASAGLAPGAAAAAPVSEPAPSGARALSGSAVHRVARPAGTALGSSASSGSSGSSLSEQVQSLDRARVALGSGDAGTALSEIAHYRKAWPQGVFLTEASVLEIEALASRGQRSLAAARAAAFVAAHPDSPQAERLRRLIPDPKP